MTIASKSVVMGRIEAATPESPIAVFTCDEQLMFDAHFASTVSAQERIAEGKGLVGVFDQTMNRNAINTKLVSMS